MKTDVARRASVRHRAFFCVLVGFISCASAPFLHAGAVPAWALQVPPPIAGHFPPPKPARLTYSAGWAGMVAGRVRATFSTTADRKHLHLTGGTVGPARVLYRLDTDSTSTCRESSFSPVRADIREIYSDGERRTIQKYSPAEVARVRTCNPPKPGDGIEKKIGLPNLFDLQGSMLYVRSQRLKPGDEMTFLAYATDSPYLAKVKVVGREDLTVRAGKFSALKLKLELQSVSKELALKPYKKAKNVTAWVSDDANRYFLKFTADLLIGSVFVELEQVEAS